MSPASTAKGPEGKVAGKSTADLKYVMPCAWKFCRWPDKQIWRWLLEFFSQSPQEPPLSQLGLMVI